MGIQSFRDLLVWQKSMQLVQRIYVLTEKLPSSEKYALSDQMRRCAISIPSNIAEGFERNSTKEYIQFLSVANGSKSELITQLEICKLLGFVEDVQDEISFCDEIGKMLNVIMKKLGADPH